MKLHHQITGSGRPLIIIHGLFGSSDNWRMLAKQLSQSAQVITIDLRNHGQSPHSEEQNYQLMADDLAELIHDLKLEQVDIIGHSIGGKVAMAFSDAYSGYCRKLVVVDIAPKHYKQEHNAIFNALLALDLSLYSKRNEVDAALSELIADKAIRQFLLMNLALAGEVISWRINLSALFNNYPNLLKPVCVSKQVDIPTCFIRGGASHYIIEDDLQLISSTFINSELITIDGAGHWVHAEQPKVFLEKVSEFLDYA